MGSFLLCNAKLNKKYKISFLDVKQENLFFRLVDLGFLNGEFIVLKKRSIKKNTFIVNVSGKDYALRKEIINYIYVELSND